MAVQKKLLDKYSKLILVHARQTVLSYILSLGTNTVFLLLFMLYKRGSDNIILEVVFLPLIIDCLQVIALSNIHMKSPLYKHLQVRTKDCKITIIDQAILFVFFIMLCLATRLQGYGIVMPYTAACTPLVIMLLQRFIWHQSFFKAFKTPQHVIKYIFQFLAVNLIFNFSLSADEYITFDVIALLWPFYGMIALTFIFFAASLLLFIGSACNQFSSSEEEVANAQNGEEGQLFTCTISTGLLIHSGFFLAFSIVGFLTLLMETRDGTIFQQGYIGIIISAIISGIYIICQLHQVVHWYNDRMLKPQIANELFSYYRTAKHQELDQIDASVVHSINSMMSVDHNMQVEQPQRSVSQQSVAAIQQNRRNDIENITKQAIFRRDLQEINKIELLDEAEAEVKGKILGAVPLFLIKVSRSYFQKVEQYSKQFMNRVTTYQNNFKATENAHQPGSLMNLPNMPGNLGLRQRKKKLAQKGILDSKQKGSNKRGMKTRDQLKSFNLRAPQKQGIMNLIKEIKNSQEMQVQHQTETDKISIPDESSNRLAQQAIKVVHLENSLTDMLQQPKKEDMDELEFYDMPFGLEKEQVKAQSALKLNNRFSNLYQSQDMLKKSMNSEADDADDKNNVSNEIVRMCLTSQLCSVQISDSIETSSDESSSVTEGATQKSKSKQSPPKKKKVLQANDSIIPDPEAKLQEQKKKRRKSFDLTLLKAFKYKKVPRAKQMKNNLAKLLDEINNEMGLNATLNESDDDESIDTIKRLNNMIKQPFTMASATKGATEGQDDEGAIVKNLCMLCLERKSDAVIMDCGHSKICFFCAYKMYRTQNLCHLCRQEINKVIKIKRSHGLAYQKVIGILQKFNDKFYYSDVNQDLVKELKIIKKMEKKEADNLDGTGKVTALSMRSEDCDMTADLIDEGVGTQLIEIERGRYALAPNSGVDIFQRDEAREQRLMKRAAAPKAERGRPKKEAGDSSKRSRHNSL